MKKRIIAALMIAVLCVTAFSTLTVSAAEVNEVTPRAAVYYYTTATVNLRSGPVTTYATLVNIPAMTRIAVYSISSGWANVSFGSYSGYVSTSYLVIASSVMKVTGGSAPLYKDTNASASYGTMSYGTRVRNYGSANTTYNQVSPLEGTLKGYVGYCKKANLTAAG